MIGQPELRDVLTRQAESYEVPPPDLMRLRAAALMHRRASRRRYAGIAAATMLVAGVVVGALFVGQEDLQRDVRPAERVSDDLVSPSCIPGGEIPTVPGPYAHGDGFLADEPVSATSPGPGDPSCTLVLRYWAHRFGAGGAQLAPLTSYMVWLYSDGRLILDTDEDQFVQWERRLTPAGVERVRQMMVAGLGRPVDKPDRAAEAAIHFGDGIYYPQDSEALRDRLMDWSWLADRDWVTEQRSHYRAAWYVTCYDRRMSGADDSLQDAVRALPVGARDILESRAWTTFPPEARLWGNSYCMVLSRDDATALAEALGGVINDGKAEVFGWQKPEGPVGFHLNALMPDGTPGAHGE